MKRPAKRPHKARHSQNLPASPALRLRRLLWFLSGSNHYIFPNRDKCRIYFYRVPKPTRTFLNFPCRKRLDFPPVGYYRDNRDIARIYSVLRRIARRWTPKLILAPKRQNRDK